MKEAINEYISQHLLAGATDTAISNSDDLLGSGLIDSMGMMRLIAFIEERFGIQVPPEEMVLEHFMTINDMEAYLLTKQ